MSIRKALITFILITISYSFAQDFTGKYILKEGGIVLTLEQQANNIILGTLTGPEISFELEGELSPDDANTAYGYIFTSESNLLFAIVLEEPKINMIAFAILENGDPDPEDSETFLFIRETNQTDTQTTTNNPDRLPTNNQAVNTNPNTTNAQQNPLPQITNGQNPLANKDPFIGLFVGEGLSLELNKEDNIFVGKIEFDGNSFPVAANKDTSTLIGRFKVGDDIFSFSAVLSQDILHFVTDGASYSLKRQ